MDAYSLILHLTHIGCGVFWGGTALMLHFFLIPAVKKAGANGPLIMQGIMSTRNFPIVMVVNAFITVGAGILLLEYVSGGFQREWFGTKMGIVLSFGATTGSMALLIGLFMNKPAADKMRHLGIEIANSGNPPTAAQLAVLDSNRNRLMLGLKLIAWLMIVTILCMAGAHYV